MKVFTILLSIVAVALIIYNSTKVDLNSPFEGESITAIITVVAAICAILLLQILRVSKKIERKIKLKK